VLERNVGFAPAVNVGVKASHGEYICVLNSDVFASTEGWLEQLVGRLEADTSLGIVSPILLFEDGTLQHGGCGLRRRPE
ncbi:glycosyltransferase, partial [Klebsiella oxytoca]|uniref:glycosyltransferase n=1 Tax=Klebsiella oxytoca TaxID=571 RepID=UPI0013CFB7CE